jgi:hypothetical protein
MNFKVREASTASKDTSLKDLAMNIPLCFISIPTISMTPEDSTVSMKALDTARTKH